jgi:HEPN domain-containing protein
MDSSQNVLEWIRFSEMDLGAAELLLAHHPLAVEIICFHCQQSAEKILKGFLIAYNVQPPKIHDLIILLTLCENVVSVVSKVVLQCNFLNKFSVVTRYPNELQLNETDARVAVRYAKEVSDFIKPFILQKQNDILFILENSHSPSP